MKIQTKALSDDELNRIHAATMAILETVGIKVNDSTLALDVFETGGCTVDRYTSRVFFPSSVMQRILSCCQPGLTLYDTAGEPTIRFGGNRNYFGTHGFPSLVCDTANGKLRDGCYADLIEFLKLTDVLEYPQIVAPSIQPTDIDNNIGDLVQAQAALQITGKPLYLQAFSGSSVKAIHEMLITMVGDTETLRQQPHTIFCVCTYSPLTIRKDAAEVLMESAKLGDPVYITSGAMGGATAPVTLCGELAQVNAEILAHVALSKLIDPDAPVVYASSCRLFDMKFGVCASSTPEYALLRAATSQLGQFYHLPTGGGGLNADASTVDAQYGWEKLQTTLIPAMAGQDLILGMGMLSQMNAVSNESLVIDCDIVHSVNRITQGVRVDEDRLGLEVIRNHADSSGFMSDVHTMKYFRDEAWIPRDNITDRSLGNNWQMNGSRTALNRASERVAACLDAYKGPDLSDEIRQRLDEIVISRGNQ